MPFRARAFISLTERAVAFRTDPQGFGYRWLRSKDVMDVGGALRGSAAACPVVKQLLGWTHVRTFSSSSATLPRQT